MIGDDIVLLTFKDYMYPSIKLKLKSAKNRELIVIKRHLMQSIMDGKEQYKPIMNRIS